MILNDSYYKQLYDKYKEILTIHKKFNNKFIELIYKLIIYCYRNGVSIHINFQLHKDILNEIGELLYTELANEIYLKFADLPKTIDVGQQFKELKTGKLFIIENKKNDLYRLKEVLNKNQQNRSPIFLIDRKYDDIITSFIRVKIGVQDKTIKNYIKFFDELNKEKSEFPRTIFNKKSVFIAQKSFYDSLNLKNKIPTTYLPNSREEAKQNELMSIPALPDSLIYFVPRYKLCYENILMDDKKIDTIVVFDTDEIELEQIINDKNRFGFKLIVLTNNVNPTKHNQLYLWNWFKEEIKLIETI